MCVVSFITFENLTTYYRASFNIDPFIFPSMSLLKVIAVL